MKHIMDLMLNFIFYCRDSNSGPLHHDRSGSSSSSNNNTVGKTKCAYILQCFAGPSYFHNIDIYKS